MGGYDRIRLYRVLTSISLISIPPRVYSLNPGTPVMKIDDITARRLDI